MRTDSIPCHGLGGRFAALLAVAVLTTGCPRILSIDYKPSTSIKGSGPVRVDPFLYRGHPTGLMKSKELESGRRDAEALYLSQDIGSFFTIAFQKELVKAGYDVKPEATRIVSGTIEHFFLDYAGEADQRFQIRVIFNSTTIKDSSFTSTCQSDRQQTRDWSTSGLLIERGVKDCIEQFLKAAQAADAL
ncbi:MAG TPA: hypothetical protein VIU63_09625 [Nitrospira sp.]